MNSNDRRRRKTTRDHCFLDPREDIIAGTARVVAEIVIQAQLDHLACFQEGDGFLRPPNGGPARRCRPFVIEEYLHGNSVRSPPNTEISGEAPSRPCFVRGISLFGSLIRLLSADVRVKRDRLADELISLKEDLRPPEAGFLE